MRNTLSAFLQRDAFSKPDIHSRIPDDIHVAMHIARALGLRYLWCDRFCIVQDEDEVKSKQIANMASIYAHSVLTIVCAAHAPQGLNFKQGSKPRGHCNFYQDSIWGEKCKHDRLVKSSVWSSRGWTLQEMVFSQRAIFVHKDSITWQCHCMVQDEGSKVEHSPCNWRFSEVARGLHFSPWPDLGEYSRLVSDYSRRFLTYEDDVLRAFSGVTNTLTKTFLGGFHFGLPRLFFDTAMLWQARGRLTRRDRESFPSWSWAGWIGKIDVGNWEMGSNYVLAARSYHPTERRGSSNVDGTYFRVISSVPWMVVGTKRPLIDSPPGSSEQQVSLQGLIDNETCTQGSLVDENAHRSQWKQSGENWSHPCDGLKEFRYPIPVVSDFSSGIAEIPPSLFHLQAMTTTARLWCVEKHASKDIDAFGDINDLYIDAGSDRGCPRIQANIYGSHKREGSFCIGTLQSDGQGVGDSAAGKGTHYCKFVALSEVYARDHDEECFGGRQFLRYVNVLWVDEVGDVLYRRGLGRVYKKAWLKYAEQRNVVLG